MYLARMQARASHDYLILGGGERHQAHWVAECLNGMEQLEVLEVVYKHLVLQGNHNTLSPKLDCSDLPTHECSA